MPDLPVAPEKIAVVVTDVQMPFVSMVILWIKVALAAVPALIILSLLGAIGMAILTGVMSELALLR